MSQADIVVVGSSNYDMFTYVPQFPKRGETVQGSAFKTGFGGKGANEAVCAAILGARVAFVGKVGGDSFGSETIRNFEKHGVDISHLAVAQAGVSTGIATICVEDSGENNIVVVKGANGEIDEAQVSAAEKLISKSKAVLCQNEIDISRTVQSLTLARKHNVLTIFNPSPSEKHFPDSLYELVEVWCLNETELSLLAPTTEGSIAEKVAQFYQRCSCKAVIVTLGAKGALLYDSQGISNIPVPQVEKVVDTTGAGDAFLASFAVSFIDCRDMIQACKTACRLSAETVKFRGCQASYLYLKDLYTK